MEAIVTQHLIQNEDLDLHGNLSAGKAADWMIETAFMTAASLLPSESIVAVRINEISFLAPVFIGDMLKIIGKIVYAGTSSLMVYVLAKVRGNKVIESFSTFVHVDENGHSVSHGITIEAMTKEEIVLMERAGRLLTVKVG